MGSRETRICDICKCDLPFGDMGFPKFRAAEVQIKLYKSGWGNVDWLVGWKGELCEECVAIVNRTAEFFHREMNQRQVTAKPGEHVLTPEAVPRRRCADCGHPEKPHRYRHRFVLWEPGMPEPRKR